MQISEAIKAIRTDIYRNEALNAPDYSLVDAYNSNSNKAIRGEMYAGYNFMRVTDNSYTYTLIPPTK